MHGAAVVVALDRRRPRRPRRRGPARDGPPSRAESVTGRSRFTGSPGASRRALDAGQRLLGQVERQVRRRSRHHGEAHTVHRDRRADVAVGDDRAASHDEPGRAGLERPTPRSSTIPVNIGLHPQVVADPLDVDDPQRGRLADRSEPVAHQHAGGVRPADQLRGEVQHDAVDEAPPARSSTRASRRLRPARPGRRACPGAPPASGRRHAARRILIERRRRRRRRRAHASTTLAAGALRWSRPAWAPRRRRCGRRRETRPDASTTTRSGGRPRYAGSRTVSEGSSAITVPAPTTIASAAAAEDAARRPARPRR